MVVGVEVGERRVDGETEEGKEGKEGREGKEGKKKKR